MDWLIDWKTRWILEFEKQVFPWETRPPRTAVQWFQFNRSLWIKARSPGNERLQEGARQTKDFDRPRINKELNPKIKASWTVQQTTIRLQSALLSRRRFKSACFELPVYRRFTRARRKESPTTFRGILFQQMIKCRESDRQTDGVKWTPNGHLSH
jgi:hypothetical protein